jgi:hypothetical protein
MVAISSAFKREGDKEKTVPTIGVVTSRAESTKYAGRGRRRGKDWFHLEECFFERSSNFFTQHDCKTKTCLFIFFEFFFQK